MTKTALLFSGQGSQYAEMGAELVGDFQAARDVFSLGSEILGYDLQEKINKGELESTLITQPAVFAVSCAALEAARESGIAFGAVAGHSLGEYAALVACGVITLEDGFKLLKIRSEIMHKTAEISGGGMAAIAGPDTEIVVETVCKHKKDIMPVNYNSPQQIVIAGSREALLEAEKLYDCFAHMTKKNARFIYLNVAAAFHSPLMNGAAAEFEAAVTEAGFTFKTPEIPFCSNLTGGFINEITPAYLAKHICSPVLFTAQLNAMNSAGYSAFLELGPGKVLSGLTKKTLGNATICNIQDIKSLEAAKSVLL